MIRMSHCLGPVYQSTKGDEQVTGCELEAGCRLLVDLVLLGPVG